MTNEPAAAPTFTRRRVLGLGAAAVGLAGLGAWRVLDDEPDTAAVVDEAGSGPTGDRLVLDVGRRYLDQVPEEADQAVLVSLLPGGFEDDASSSDFGTAVAEGVSVDFAESDTVELDGWLLSVTECRAAAWFALG